MEVPTLPRIPVHVRVKILVVVLAISVCSLAVTGYVALTAIKDIGKYAEGSSQALGESAVVDSSEALRHLSEAELVKITVDQAIIADTLFSDTSTEMELLAAHAAEARNSSAMDPAVPAFDPEHPPEDPLAGPLVSFAPDATILPGSPEARTAAGVDDMLKAVYTNDPDMTAVYLGTDSGMFRRFPGNGTLPAGYDPRTRDWYQAATTSGTITWSDAPYEDAAGYGLIMTCSKAIGGGTYGTWVIGSDISVEAINQDFLTSALGSEASAFLIDGHGDLISRPGLTSTTPAAGAQAWSGFVSTSPAVSRLVANMTAGKTGLDRVWYNGTEMYVAYAPLPSMNWSLAVAMPVSAITEPVKRTENRITTASNSTASHISDVTGQFIGVYIILFILILILVVFLSVLLSRMITRPVETLKEGAQAIGRGDLAHRVAITSGDEFEELAGSFNTMAADLKASIEDLRVTTAAKERYAREMEIARTIQASILPESVPEIPGFDLAAAMIPAMEIGGDFYDFIPLQGRKTGMVIADVSGKGASAALFMALSRTLIHAEAQDGATPEAVIANANRMICEDGRSGMFVTVFYSVLDPARRTFAYVNAGHNPPVLVRDGAARPLGERQGAALGLVEDATIAPAELVLARGDLIVMYTDGVTEAFSDRDEYFGEDRLNAFLLAHRHLPAAEILAGIVAAIRAFAGTAPQSDDITLVVLKVE